MKKFIAVILLGVLAVTLGACSEKLSTNPLCCVWAARYNDEKSQVMFSFYDSGDLEIVIWDWDDEKGELAQTANYDCTYTAQDGVITATYDGADYKFDYTLEKEKTLTLTYEGNRFTLYYKFANAAD